MYIGCPHDYTITLYFVGFSFVCVVRECFLLISVLLGIYSFNFYPPPPVGFFFVRGGGGLMESRGPTEVVLNGGWGTRPIYTK